MRWCYRNITLFHPGRVKGGGPELGEVEVPEWWGVQPPAGGWDEDSGGQGTQGEAGLQWAAAIGHRRPPSQEQPPEGPRQDLIPQGAAEEESWAGATSCRWEVGANEHEGERAPVADQEQLWASGGDIRQQEGGERWDAVSDKKLMSEIFILHKFLCCLDLKRSCPSCFFGRNMLQIFI